MVMVVMALISVSERNWRLRKLLVDLPTMHDDQDLDIVARVRFQAKSVSTEARL
jgi:hypothetical protein